MYPLKKVSFVQTDEIRDLYDSYAVIRTLQEQAIEEKKNPNKNIYVVNQ